VSDLPGLYEYYSFVFFFPAFLAGPSHHFIDYHRLCDGSLFEDEFAKGEKDQMEREKKSEMGRERGCVCE